MVAATGARILAAVDLKNNHFNLFVVAISVGFGMIPLVAPNFFKNLPHDLHPLLESGIFALRAGCGRSERLLQRCRSKAGPRKQTR